MKQKIVSVIIPNYNYGHFVAQAIESVLNQTYENIELIVVNNGSTDESLAVLQMFEKDIVLIDQPNLGQSGARNAGLRRATGDLIAFLDADDIWEPSKLEKQVPLLTDSVHLVYCGIALYMHAKLDSTRISLPKYKGNCMRYFVDHPGASIVLSGESTAIFSRELLNTVGFFDTELNSTAGWDYFRRCSRVTNFDYVGEPLVKYRLHETNMSNSKKNVVSDMRRAYSKLFADDEWSISESEKINIRKYLEFSFFKTYAKDLDFKSATSSAIKLFRLHSKLT